MKHLLSLEKLLRADMDLILENAKIIKAQRGDSQHKPLAGQVWALIFTKSSTRTRVSFEVGIRELGGQVMFLNANDIQLGRGEPIKDTARVLGRMIHGAVIRTFAQADVEEFAQYSGIPTVNALTDDEHPCQVLTDIFTFQEKRGPIQGKVVTFIGDGACNMPISWILAAAKLGFELRIAAPKGYQPSPTILQRAGAPIIVTEDLKAAATGADLLYTDVWVSMGQGSGIGATHPRPRWLPNQSRARSAREARRAGDALPARLSRQEIDEKTFEAHAQTIFDQAENRLTFRRRF
jgi:ornithine carbamoyltransferase